MEQVCVVRVMLSLKDFPLNSLYSRLNSSTTASRVRSSSWQLRLPPSDE